MVYTCNCMKGHTQTQTLSHPPTLTEPHTHTHLNPAVVLICTPCVVFTLVIQSGQMWFPVPFKNTTEMSFGNSYTYTNLSHVCWSHDIIPLTWLDVIWLSFTLPDSRPRGLKHSGGHRHESFTICKLNVIKDNTGLGHHPSWQKHQYNNTPDLTQVL